MAVSESESRVEQVLRERGKTRQWLADELGVSRQVLHRWITGRAPWPAQPVDRKAQVAQLLGADKPELFQGNIPGG